MTPNRSKAEPRGPKTQELPYARLTGICFARHRCLRAFWYWLHLFHLDCHHVPGRADAVSATPNTTLEPTRTGALRLSRASGFSCVFGPRGSALERYASRVM